MKSDFPTPSGQLNFLYLPHSFLHIKSRWAYTHTRSFATHEKGPPIPKLREGLWWVWLQSHVHTWDSSNSKSRREMVLGGASLGHVDTISWLLWLQRQSKEELNTFTGATCRESWREWLGGESTELAREESRQESGTLPCLLSLFVDIHCHLHQCRCVH